MVSRAHTVGSDAFFNRQHQQGFTHLPMDLQFIANAKEDIAALIAEVERLHRLLRME